MTTTTTPAADTQLCEWCGHNPAAEGSRYCCDEHRRFDIGNENTWRYAATHNPFRKQVTR